MYRIDCLRFLSEQHTDELVICNLGHTSADWWDVNPRRDEDTFYMRSSMGLVSSMALGLALALPHRKVWAFYGDRSLTMNLNSLLTLGKVRPKNMLHIVWLNHQYVDLPLTLGEGADLAGVARSSGIRESHTFRTLEEFKE